MNYTEWCKNNKKGDEQLCFNGDMYYLCAEDYLNDEGYIFDEPVVIEAEDTSKIFPKDKYTGESLAEVIIEKISDEMFSEECCFGEYVTDHEDLIKFLNEWLEKQNYHLFYPNGVKVEIRPDEVDYWKEVFEEEEE